jgi:EAL domain-containing protein (putative c-di-GMP-specific phosphodiesterase class I)
MIQLDKLMNESAVTASFQPEVSLTDSCPIGYEILGRGNLDGMKSPAEMFSTAARLDLEGELSRELRREGARIATKLPVKLNLFVNTHPSEIGDAKLPASLEELRQVVGNRQVTIEVHEAAVANPTTMRELRGLLTDLDMKLAYDDFGAGQARLLELTEVPPDFVKFDIQLIRDIHLGPVRRQMMVARLVEMVRDQSIAAVAEGVESAEEAEECCRLGFDYAQGFYFGRPETVDTVLCGPMKTRS